MSPIASLLDDIKSRTKAFVVYRSDDETAIESQFSSHNVSVDHRELPSAVPAPFLVIEADGSFAGAIALSELEGLLEPPIVRPDADDGVSRGYRVLFDVLDETVFTAMERSQLLAVSREIEDRAFRVGTGTLRVAFQSFSTFEPQVELYRALGTRTDLDIHIHGIADWSPPEIPNVTYHSDTDGTLDRYWILAFDGGGDKTQQCSLFSKAQRDGYDGVWTDDPDLVERVLAELAAAQ